MATFDKSMPSEPVTSEPSEKKASHDTPTPQALLDFMMSSWKPSNAALPKPIDHAASYLARRNALSAMFPGDLLVIPTGHEKVRSNDTHYRFRPSSDFFYLTGNLEADCVLVLEPVQADSQATPRHGKHQHILFVEPNPGRSDSTFFTDRVKGELWVGPRLGVPQSQAYFQIDECRPLAELKDYLSERRSKKSKTVRGFAADIDALVDVNEGDRELATALSEMRLLKDALEVKELEAVMDSTKRGFEDVIRSIKKAKSEREVEGVFGLRARVEGNDVGYGTIAASGPHACVLHWTKNDGTLHKGTLLLLDAGVEGNSLYTADITRTLPISGKFSKEQKKIYTLVHKAQAAAFERVRPGNDFMDPNRAAMRVLAEGLEKLGILKSADDALKDEHQFYKRYSLHNVSHMLGLDVHDCAQARQEAYKFGKLKAGMVLTVEPGLYFQEDDLTVPEKYRGIGVRIEDDVLVTESGMRNLSEHIPSEASEVEAWMKKCWKKKLSFPIEKP